MSSRSTPATAPPAEAALARELAELGRELTAALDGLERNRADIALDGELRALREIASRLDALVHGDVEGEVARRTQELASLSAFLQTNAEREKAALARELHDELGGILTPAKMDLAWLQARLGSQAEYGERMARLGKLIDQGIDLKRRIIERLRPSLLDHLGLAAAVEWYVEEACRNANVEPHLHVGKTLERLAPDLEIALYRLVQEAVTNVVRHAKAAHLDLTLERTPEGVHMTVSDDGVGIGNVEAARKLSHGIAGMNHRLRSLNGTLHVHSPSGKGTRVEMFVPLPPA
jgi:signal transduction histidine kinase